eukprot:gnl/TRDRNA2_/TRDRNA2_153750_c0_seq1.p1 gnl/TRDRNA2_/TRDRNA2_153750_c0~~gnl/TRDRNA2_/TRDRNA2_153750_c0_seq1.p1  ORF type:complete len:386 (+),score=56.24 gnl/TRDRNA2_/TRDRNA2_153750_c0_seq1:71-1228(+)
MVWVRNSDLRAARARAAAADTRAAAKGRPQHTGCFRLGARFRQICCCAVLLVALLYTAMQYRRDMDFYKLFLDCREPEEPLDADADASSLDVVHVVYSSDRKGFGGLLSSMLSLSRRLAEPGLCSIHLLVPATDVILAENLAECFRRELSADDAMEAIPEVVVYELRPFDSLNVSSFAESYRRRWGRPELAKTANWARLYIHDYLPVTVPRAIYLDTDTTVLTDLGPLYRMQMTQPLAATRELKLHFQAHRDAAMNQQTRQLFNDLRPDKYFNPGVMVLDLGQWRSGELTRDIERIAAMTQWHLLATNVAIKDRVDIIDWRWNSQGFSMDLPVPSTCAQGARIIHWTGSAYKPWDRYKPGRFKSNDHLFEAPKLACAALPYSFQP